MISRNVFFGGILAGCGLILQGSVPANAATGIDWVSFAATAGTGTTVCKGADIAYGNGRFFAVCFNGATTSDADLFTGIGVGWGRVSPTAMANVNGYTGAAYGNGRFVTVSPVGGANSAAYGTTSSGGTWVGVNPGTTGLVRVAFGANKFVAVGYDTAAGGAVTVDPVGRAGKVSTSANGSSWTAQSSIPDGNWVAVTFGAADSNGNGTFVAVANSGTNRVMTSPDGVTWTARTPAFTGDFRSVTYASGKFVAVCATCAGPSKVMTSPDGVTWTAQSAPDQQWLSVTYGRGFGVNSATSATGDLFIASAGNATATDGIMTSPDGVTWTARASGLAAAARFVSFGNGGFMTFDDAGTDPNNGAGTYSRLPCGDGVPYVKPVSGQKYLQYATPCNTLLLGYNLGTALGNFPTGNLNSSAYNSSWVMFGRNATNSGNTQIALSDSLTGGAGYWFGGNSTIAAGQPLDNKLMLPDGNTFPRSNPAGCTVTTSTGAQQNCAILSVNTSVAGKKMMGNPFSIEVDWSAVRIRVGGTGGTTYTPTAAQAAGFIGNQFWIWNGSSYDTWNDSTNKGTFKYSHGFFIDLLPGGVGQTIDLIVPFANAPFTSGSLLDRLGKQFAALSEASGSILSGLLSTPAHAAASGNWKVTLTAKSAAQGTEGRAVLGQFAGSKEQRDGGDLAAMAPFASPFLTVVFPRTDWGTAKGDYSGDFRPATGIPRQWPFEVRASKTGTPVVLTWQGNKDVLSRSRLIDNATGQTIDPNSPKFANGYSFTMTSTVRRMTWSYLGDATPAKKK